MRVLITKTVSSWRRFLILDLLYRSRSVAETCQCLGSEELQEIRGEYAFVNMDGKNCLPVQTDSGYVACYPSDYGLQCNAWDEDLPEACTTQEGLKKSDAPSFCSDQWCYVKKNRDVQTSLQVELLSWIMVQLQNLQFKEYVPSILSKL
jgi:hypothetical protein